MDGTYHGVFRNEARFVQGRKRVIRWDEVRRNEDLQWSCLCEKSHLAHVVDDGIQDLSFERTKHDRLILDFEHRLSRMIFHGKTFAYRRLSQNADDVSITTAARSFHLKKMRVKDTL